MNQWRDFEKDPPESSLGEIICWNKEDGLGISKYITAFKGKGWWKHQEDMWFDPTHWTPAPDAPDQGNAGVGINHDYI